MRDMACAERAACCCMHLLAGRLALTASARARRARTVRVARHRAKTAEALKKQPAHNELFARGLQPAASAMQSVLPPSLPQLLCWGPGALVRLDGASSAFPGHVQAAP